MGNAQGLERLVEVMKKWTPTTSRDNEPHGTSKWTWPNRQELLAKCCYAVWLTCQHNENNQTVFCEAGGIAALVGLLDQSNDETLLEMAAGAVCAVAAECERNKDQFREENGLRPLIA